MYYSLPFNRWDADLSAKLIALVNKNQAIKQSLFPSCRSNASTKKGGGKPKTVTQFDLAMLLFTDLEGFTEAMAACKTAKERQVFGNKVKNRLSIMAQMSRDFNKEMGETGAGIKHALKIDTQVDNEPTAISAECPWYFEMRELIGQRPNLVPTGLGDSTTLINNGVLIPNVPYSESEPVMAEDETSVLSRASSVPYNDWELTPPPEHHARRRTLDKFEDDGAAVGSGDDYNPSSDAILESALPLDEPDTNINQTEDEHEQKVKGKSGKVDRADKALADSNEEVCKEKLKKTGKSQTGRKNPAKLAMSKPAVPVSAAATAQKPSKKPKITEFADIVKDEVMIRQKELELAMLRTQVQMKLMEVKGQYLEKREERKQEDKRAKREEKMLKLKLKEMKMKQDHELRMRAVTADHLSSTSHMASYFGTHTTAAGHSYSSGSSRYTPLEPDHTDYSILDSFTGGNAVAGPSAMQDYEDLSIHS
ncbi:hypothetical protein K438DRAFT_2085518 [Mycena galopus ATCC 62051]|nr:hypothetical protein K438DRAFT_2085518 [Mycena galopus ATCC 62051]